MNILITESRLFKKEHFDVLKNQKLYVENILHKDISKMRNDIDSLFIGLDTKLNESSLNLFPNLKYIVTPTTGLDHIDVDYCKKHGINIVSLKGETKFLETISPTAEHAFSLMLMILRNTHSAIDSVKKFKWDREKFVGNELNGKTLGILGYGRTGKLMAKYAQAFNMNVISYDPLKDAQKEMKKQNVNYVSWDQIFKKSDIVSVHINLDKTTYNIIKKHEFEMMKDTAFFINISRGQIVNEKDLLWALNDKIKGAGLDVLATEQDNEHPKNNSLILYAKKHDNLIITPHIGGSTHESIEKTVKFVIKKFLKHIKENEC